MRLQTFNRIAIWTFNMFALWGFVTCALLTATGLNYIIGMVLFGVAFVLGIFVTIFGIER
jgi:hypothetical protein